MGKKTFAMLIVAVVALFAGHNLYQSQSNNVALSELALANMEALAWGEGGHFDWNCWIGYDDVSSPNFFTYIDCSDCYIRSGVHLWSSSTCRY